MIDLSSILNGDCALEVLSSWIPLGAVIYRFTCMTVGKWAQKETLDREKIIQEKNQEIKRLQGLVDNYTQQLINRNNNV